MILTVDEMTALPECKGKTEAELKILQNALELLIRKYTNNNFQNRAIRFTGNSLGTRIMGCHPFIQVGDTLQISESMVNDGLYVVTELGDDFTRVDGNLFTVDHNLVTKVEYPADVKIGVINLLKYELTMRDKVGIKTESLSRHSVTYYDHDANNQVMGYPVSLLGFLEPYKKSRF